MNAKTELSEKANRGQELEAYQELAAALAELARKFDSEYPDAPRAKRDVQRTLVDVGKKVQEMETLVARSQ